MNFICFDTEDDSRELRLAGKSGFDKQVTQIAAIKANGSKFYARGAKQKEFLQWLQVQPEKFIYALNLQYDLGNLFSKRLDELDQTLVGGRLIKAKWRNKTFVDVFNIWPMSVKKLGEAFDLEKMEFDAKSKKYVYRDVEIIREAMLHAWRFCESLGLDHCPTTLGGLCVKVWQSTGGVNSHNTNELCREGYYGGRVELFKTANESATVAYTDINSLYPAMMLKKFPAQMQDTDELLEYGISSVKIKMPKTDIGVLPWRSDDGKIYYGYGIFCGTYTNHEIRAAVARGGKLLKVYSTVGTNDYEIPYSTFVHEMYRRRLQSQTTAEKLFWKLVMNNLYGRLGTSGVISRTVYQTEKNRFDGLPFGNKVLVDYSMPLSPETNWSHAAYVTSYGRLELLKYLELVGTKDLIYCDTDSVIFDCPTKVLPFDISDKLGEMKLESWETLCETYAPKMYRLGKNYKAKGVPKIHAQKFIETGKARFDLPFKMRESIRFYDRKNSKELSVWREVEKQRQNSYDKKNLKKNLYFPCNLTGKD